MSDDAQTFWYWLLYEPSNDSFYSAAFSHAL